MNKNLAWLFSLAKDCGIEGWDKTIAKHFLELVITEGSSILEMLRSVSRVQNAEIIKNMTKKCLILFALTLRWFFLNYVLVGLYNFGLHIFIFDVVMVWNPLSARKQNSYHISKNRRLVRVSTFRGGLLEKRGDLFEGGLQFLHKLN